MKNLIIEHLVINLIQKAIDIIFNYFDNIIIIFV